MSSDQGATLLETLIVISLISILSAILFPALAAAKNSAQGVHCIDNLSQIGFATALYRQDYDDRLPYAVAAETKKFALISPASERGALFSEAVKLPTVDVALFEYLKAPLVWHCDLDSVEWLFQQENVVLPPNLQWKQSYFVSVGSSYDYDDVTAVLHDGIEQLPSSSAILFTDYAAVHGPVSAGKLGMRNLLFEDGHAKLDNRNLWGSSFVPPQSNEWQ